MISANILLVEDNPGDIVLTQIALSEVNLTNKVWTVQDGEEAIKFLKKEGLYAKCPTPDLILLDLKLPGRSGLEILQEIKSTNIMKRIPVIILTSSSVERDIISSYDKYANCYLVKPVGTDNFLEVAQSLKEFWFQFSKLPTQS